MLWMILKDNECCQCQWFQQEPEDLLFAAELPLTQCIVSGDWRYPVPSVSECTERGPCTVHSSVEVLLQSCRGFFTLISEHPVPIRCNQDTWKHLLGIPSRSVLVLSISCPCWLPSQLRYGTVLSSLLTPFLLLLNLETKKGSLTQQELCSARLIWTSLLASRILAHKPVRGKFLLCDQFVAALYQTSGRNVCSGFSKYCNPTYSVWPAHFELQLDHFMELFCFQSFHSPKWLERGLFYFAFY